MVAIPQVQDWISGPSQPQEEAFSRPPDAAIRANEAIMTAGMDFFGRLLEASASRTGLNTVIGGSNPGTARPPEKISGLNGQSLAGLQDSGAAPKEDAPPGEDATAKEDVPAKAAEKPKAAEPESAAPARTGKVVLAGPPPESAPEAEPAAEPEGSPSLITEGEIGLSNKDPDAPVVWND